MAGSPFRDRVDAGRQLARALEHHRGTGALVLGLPRGGVPVAAEVAAALATELDVLVVRKLGVPGHEELAMGAVAGGGLRVLNHDVLGRLAPARGRGRRGHRPGRRRWWPNGNGTTGATARRPTSGAAP